MAASFLTGPINTSAQTAFANQLADMNTNQNFVQPTQCPATFTAVAGTTSTVGLTPPCGQPSPSHILEAPVSQQIETGGAVVGSSASSIGIIVGCVVGVAVIGAIFVAIVVIRKISKNSKLPNADLP